VEPLQGGEDRKAGGKHHTHADGNAQRLVLDLPAQAVYGSIEIVPGDEFGHDELPDSFGVSLGMVLRDAIIAKVLGLSESIKRKRHPRFLYWRARLTIPPQTT
jgi:hypothetical protein